MQTSTFAHMISRLRWRIQRDSHLPKLNASRELNVNVQRELRRVWLEGVYVRFNEIMMVWLSGEHERALEMYDALERCICNRE